MKKLVLMMAAVALTVGANAATTKWNGQATTDAFKFSGAALTTGTGSQTASLTAYFMLLSDKTGLSSATTRTEAAALAKATATGLTSTSTTAAGRLAGSSAIASDVAPGVDYFARVYLTVDGKDYYYDTDKWTTTAAAGATNIGTLSWTGKGGDVTWTAVGAVPEPCAVALLVLGVAALGLKRRIA